MTLPTIDDGACRSCGRPACEAHCVLSRHGTSEGVVTWLRCPCGALQARFRPYGRDTERLVTSSDEAPGTPPGRYGPR